MPNLKTVALDGILNDQACFCSLEIERAIGDPCDLCRARAELAALRSRPREKSVEECRLTYARAFGRIDDPSSVSEFDRRHNDAIKAVRAFLLDEEAGRG